MQGMKNRLWQVTWGTWLSFAIAMGIVGRSWSAVANVIAFAVFLFCVRRNWRVLSGAPARNAAAGQLAREASAHGYLSTVLSRIWLILLMMAVTFAGSVYYVCREIDGSLYLSYAQAWPRVSEPTRQKFSAAMADGKITQWESADLLRSVIPDGGLSICSTTSACAQTPSEQGREVLKRTMGLS